MSQRKLFYWLAFALVACVGLAGHAFPQHLQLNQPQAIQQQPAPSPTPAATTAPAVRDERLWREAQRIHSRALVVDTHNDITSPMTDEDYDLGTPSVGQHHTDIARMKAGGLTAEFFSIYVDKSYAKDGGSARRALDMIDMVYRAIERHPRDLLFSTSTADIRRARRERRIAALMGIEGGHAIENSLSALRDFYRLGIRYMTLTHNNTNDWADSARDERLKPQLDALAEEFKNDPKRLAAETKKVEDANPLPTSPPLSVLIDHIDHIGRVAGIDHVGLGSDFDGVPSLPQGMQDVSALPNITYELLRRGYSERDIRKVLGENFMRVFSQAERVAQSTRSTISGEGSVRRIETTPGR